MPPAFETKDAERAWNEYQNGITRSDAPPRKAQAAIKAACERFDVSASELLSPSNAKAVTYARRVLIGALTLNREMSRQAVADAVCRTKDGVRSAQRAIRDDDSGQMARDVQSLRADVQKALASLKEPT